ncbi:hypothetical protein [Maribellus maritimus]|uniref:hypothetical protein n=1 Tax=Maribellus maritimus TaxID=2870838 RepID=UPI001EEA8239|nr:hypothetical protein [Maribellus maritimus]MCG6189464.1 hypothetical protein [Maribellus maritimus]
MNSISITGAFIITLSLLSYGIGSISLQRFRMVSPGVLWFLTLGVVLDIVATIFMIVGAKNPGFTLHGFLGYSALLVMLIDVIFIWQIYYRENINAHVGKKLLTYSKIAYGWWIVAYITGSLLIIWR